MTPLAWAYVVLYEVYLNVAAVLAPWVRIGGRR